MNKILLATIPILILLTSCQPAPTAMPLPLPTSTNAESPVSSISDLVGVWWFPQGPMKIEFKADGAYRMWNDDSTQAQGTYTLDAGKITWATSQPACVDQPATYAASIISRDGKTIQLRLQVMGNDPCILRIYLPNSVGNYMNP